MGGPEPFFFSIIPHPAASFGPEVCKLGPIRNVLEVKGLRDTGRSLASPRSRKSRDFDSLRKKVLVELELALANVQGFDSGIQSGW